VAACTVALVALAIAGTHAQQTPAGPLPAVVGPQPGARRGATPQNQTPRIADMMAMMSAAPSVAPAVPKQPRRVFVFGRPAMYGPHASLPLAARTIETLGAKTGAWSTMISYSLNDVTADNLANYDAIVLTSTTGSFLDDPADAAGTGARRRALLDFVRGGKGLVAIHSATDTYHSVPNGGDPLWPDFNNMIDGYFKWHWAYPSMVFVKVEDPANPVNAAFTSPGRNGGPRTARPNLFVVDEVYTYAQKSWDRTKAHVLTSIDYARMPESMKAEEPADGKRTDGDYVLSYIRREGQGHVFVDVLGHDESIYTLPAQLEHMLAGVQYAIGDLLADDTPSAK